MHTVTRQATIAAPIEMVWSVLADFAAISAWAENVDHSCLMSTQTEGLGMTRRIQTGPLTVLESVETWEPPHSIGYQLTGLPAVVKSVTNTWELVPNGQYTVASLTTRITTGPRPPQKAVAKVIGKQMAKASDQMLAGLDVAARLEAAS